MAERTYPASVVIDLIERYALPEIACYPCAGTGEFDHGSGQGYVDECIPGDRNNPPHRNCPCKSCGASGTDPDARRQLVELVGENAVVKAEAKHNG